MVTLAVLSSGSERSEKAAPGENSIIAKLRHEKNPLNCFDVHNCVLRADGLSFCPGLRNQVSEVRGVKLSVRDWGLARLETREDSDHGPEARDKLRSGTCPTQRRPVSLKGPGTL